MIIAGLTGGICSGKSTIAKTFIKNNIPVIDADQVARQVVVPGSEGLSQIVDTFGHAYLQEDGTLDRVKLGELVFSNPISIQILNKIMAPLIEAEAAIQFNKLRQDGCQLCVWDAALIVEVGNADKYRPLIVAYCGRETQLERLISRNGLTRQQACDRMDSQMSPELKTHMADYIIYTWATVDESILQTEFIIKKIKEAL